MHVHGHKLLIGLGLSKIFHKLSHPSYGARVHPCVSVINHKYTLVAICKWILNWKENREIKNSSRGTFGCEIAI